MRNFNDQAFQICGRNIHACKQPIQLEHERARNLHGISSKRGIQLRYIRQLKHRRLRHISGQSKCPFDIFPKIPVIQAKRILHLWRELRGCVRADPGPPDPPLQHEGGRGKDKLHRVRRGQPVHAPGRVLHAVQQLRGQLAVLFPAAERPRLLLVHAVGPVPEPAVRREHRQLQLAAVRRHREPDQRRLRLQQHLRHIQVLLHKGRPEAEAGQEPGQPEEKGQELAEQHAEPAVLVRLLRVLRRRRLLQQLDRQAAPQHSRQFDRPLAGVH